MELTYSTPEVAAACGVTTRQIDHWIRKGYATTAPRHETATSGTPLRFAYGNVLRIGALAALVHAGLEPGRAAAAVNNGYDDGIVSIAVDYRAVARKLEETLPSTPA